ncbi:MAG: hypothetical protein KJ067_24005 [Vicinamibacteria bacterium]|nr:hypothetical protein [Vicinamibacteria bacterium]
MASLVLLVACAGSPGPSAGAGGSASPTPTAAPTPVAPAPQPILDIAQFLERCPQEDPAYERIRFDVEIRRNGAVVTDVPCSGVASSLPVEQFTDELITLQSLRVLYHMDAGLANHLPWTDKRAYEWFVSKVGGVQLRDSQSPSCCSQFGQRFFVNWPLASDAGREFDRSWLGISGNVSTYLHEARHRDGFPHSSCCGVTNGCDETYDTANLSAYGVHFWITRAWLEGIVNVGMGCQGARTLLDEGLIMRNTANGYASRFCSQRPPLVTLPSEPGGPCPS